jgi:hypothetical protein
LQCVGVVEFFDERTAAVIQAGAFWTPVVAIHAIAKTENRLAFRFAFRQFDLCGVHCSPAKAYLIKQLATV